MAGKADIRRKILRSRNAMAHEEIAVMSQEIVKRLIGLAAIRGATTVMVFLSFGTEVLTDELIRWGWAAGKRIAVPLCNPEDRELIPCRIDTFEDLQRGHYGIREPKAGLVRPLPRGEIDAVLVPAVAFDRRGSRVGYGGGYYDRFLPEVPRATRIGVVFACQIVEGIPAGPHDVAVDGIVTEKEIIIPVGSRIERVKGGL
jgi:5-formyltetrahydrofolate cyclo-ligase